MAKMPEVERFNVGPDPEHPGYSEMHPHPTAGAWVRYPDFEKVEAEREEAITLLEVERKDPGSVERGQEFAAGVEAGRQRVREALGGNVHRVAEALDTWLLDYADPDDGDWPERAEYVSAISTFKATLSDLEDPDA
jgi:hypothetical protein